MSLDIPYFLRSIIALKRIKRALRLRSENFGLSQTAEKVLILVFTVLFLLYTWMCIFQYVELYMQPAKPDGQYEYRLIALQDILYYIVITVSTVGYGDITPTSIPGRLVIIILILCSLAIVPALVSSTLETMNVQRSGGGSFTKGRSPFVVIIGKFDTVNRVLDVLNSFLSTHNRPRDLRVVILSRTEPTPAIKSLINNSFYRSRVVFLQGTGLDKNDLKRAQIQYASAGFIVACKNRIPFLKEAHYF